jgi:hypothetical protein
MEQLSPAEDMAVMAPVFALNRPQAVCQSGLPASAKLISLGRLDYLNP